MACNCENYSCLSVVQQYSNCPSVLTLQLAADETGTWNWEYEFNGRLFGGNIDVEDGENIVLPWVFNEHYIHLIKFYNTDGELFNDTCYKLDTSKISGNYTVPSEGGSTNYLTFTVTEEMLSNDNETVTNGSIANRTIIAILDGSQAYNSGSFTQTNGNANNYTMTNGAAAYVGQIVTLIFA